MNKEDKYRNIAVFFIKEIKKSRALFKNHRPSIGYVGEFLLRHGLKRILPNDFGVCQGFVLNDKSKKEDKLSRQCDIIVFRKGNGAIAYSVGDLKVINASSVVAVIEVKSSIGKKTFFTTLDAFKKLSMLGVRNRFVFVFGSISKQSLLKWFTQYRFPQNYNIEYMAMDCELYDWSDKDWLPNSILSLESYKYYVLDHLQDNNNDWVGYTSYKITDKKNKEISCLQEFFATIMDLLNGSFEMDQNVYSIKDGFPLFQM
jgi:hypothetical protein